VAFDLSPPRPLTSSLYMCGAKFDTAPLRNMLGRTDTYGFLIITGKDSMLATLSGNTKNILYSFDVNLPKKHGRGGQSKQRFERLAEEARHRYLAKLAEFATQYFITNEVPNIKGLILAGSANLKQRLLNSKLLDERLLRIVLKMVDISNGGENGLMQAISAVSGDLGNVRIVQERKIIERFQTEIAKSGTSGGGLYAFGVRDTMHAVLNGAAEIVIASDDLATPLSECSELSASAALSTTNNNTEDCSLLLEWLTLNTRHHGARLEIVSRSTAEGESFAVGFGGLGAVLRYPMDFSVLDANNEAKMTDHDDAATTVSDEEEQRRVESDDELFM